MYISMSLGKCTRPYNLYHNNYIKMFFIPQRSSPQSSNFPIHQSQLDTDFFLVSLKKNP